jgi:hypothetical protein
LWFTMQLSIYIRQETQQRSRQQNIIYLPWVRSISTRFECYSLIIKIDSMSLLLSVNLPHKNIKFAFLLCYLRYNIKFKFVLHK